MGSENSGSVDMVLRTGQIIIGALVAGVFFFLVLILVFLGARVQPIDAQAIVSLVMAFLALATLPARLFVPGLIVSSSCQKIAQGTWSPARQRSNIALPDSDEGRLLQVFLSKTIIGAAILEGSAFGNLVAFLLEGQIYSIVLAVLGMLGILLAFPTRSGLSEWLETQLRRLEEFRSMKSRG